MTVRITTTKVATTTVTARMKTSRAVLPSKVIYLVRSAPADAATEQAPRPSLSPVPRCTCEVRRARTHDTFRGVPTSEELEVNYGDRRAVPELIHRAV